MRALLVFPVISLLCVLLACGGAHASRTEEVLAWETGQTPGYPIAGFAGMKLAVRFYAPEWANWVTEVHFYIENDLVTNPTNPELPTTEEFMVLVWTPTGDNPPLPDSVVGPGVSSGELYPEDEWLHVVLPEPVEISNQDAFPNGVFFVGMEWLHRLNPYIGEELFEPADYMSYRYNWLEWELRDEGDTMIRAVVCDTLATPVQEGTWARVKAQYQ